MPFLLDTNCWMQVARAREHADIVEELLRTVPASQVFITDYALHSMLNILRRHEGLSDLPAFIARCGFGKTVGVVSISPDDLSRVVEIVTNSGLDTDDAYQYVAAELNDLALVSLDTDFDRTPRGRLTPAAALQLFKDEQVTPQQDA